MYYSKSTGGFYDRAIHGDNIPVDAVEITTAQHAVLMAAQSLGQRIEGDVNGYPVAVNPTKATPAEMWERIKAHRDRLTDTGGFLVGTKWFHSDQQSRIQQLGLVLLGANISPSLQWKTMDGSFVPMTQTLAGQVFAAAAEFDMAAFANAETHRVAMEASIDPSVYDFSSGWPATFPG